MSSFLFVFLPDRPTHLHEREGDGKRNIGMALYLEAFTVHLLIYKFNVYNNDI